MLSKAGVDRALNALNVDQLSIHTAYPDATGSNEASGGSYAKKAIVFPVSVDGERHWTGSIEIPVPAGTYGWIGMWQAGEFVARAPMGSTLEYEIQRIQADGKVRCIDFVTTLNATVTVVGGLPSELTQGDLYYVKSVGSDAGGPFVTLSETLGGSTITLSEEFKATDAQIAAYVPQTFTGSNNTIIVEELTLKLRNSLQIVIPTGYRWLETFGGTLTLSTDTPSYQLSQQISDPTATTRYYFEQGDEVIAAAAGITLNETSGELVWDGLTGAGTTVRLRIYAQNDPIIVAATDEFYSRNWSDAELRVDDSWTGGVTSVDYLSSPQFVKWVTPGGDIDSNDQTPYGGQAGGLWASQTITAGAAGTTYSIDVTSLVKRIVMTNAARAADTLLPYEHRNFGFTIRFTSTVSGARSLRFCGRLHPTQASQPKLVITGSAARTKYAECSAGVLKNGSSSKTAGPSETYMLTDRVHIQSSSTGKDLILWFDIEDIVDPNAVTQATIVLTLSDNAHNIPAIDSTGLIAVPTFNFPSGAQVKFKSGAVAPFVNGTTYFMKTNALNTFFQVTDGAGGTIVVPPNGFFTPGFTFTRGGTTINVTYIGPDGTMWGPSNSLVLNAPVVAGPTAPAPFVAGRTYYVISAFNGAGITLSATSGGATLAPATPTALSNAVLEQIHTDGGTLSVYRTMFPLYQQSILNKVAPEVGIAWETPNDDGLGTHPDVFFFDRMDSLDRFSRRERNVGGSIIVDQTAPWYSRSFYSAVGDPDNFLGAINSAPANVAYSNGDLVDGDDATYGIQKRWTGQKWIRSKWSGYSDTQYPANANGIVKECGSIDASGFVTIVDAVTRQPVEHGLFTRRSPQAVPGGPTNLTYEWATAWGLRGDWPAPFQADAALASGKRTKRMYYIDAVDKYRVCFRATPFGPIITPSGGPKTFQGARINKYSGFSAGPFKGFPETPGGITGAPDPRTELFVRGYFSNNGGFIQDMQSCKQHVGIDAKYIQCRMTKPDGSLSATGFMGEANSGAIVNGYKGWSIRLHSGPSVGADNYEQYGGLTDSPYYAGASTNLYKRGFDQWTFYMYAIHEANGMGYDLFGPNTYIPQQGFGSDGAAASLNFGYIGWLERNRQYCIEQYVRVNDLVPNPQYNRIHEDWCIANGYPPRYPWTMLSPIGLPANASGVPGTGNWVSDAGTVIGPCMKQSNVDGRVWISDGGKRSSSGTWNTAAASVGAFVSSPSGTFNTWNARYIPAMRQALIERTPTMPVRNGVYKVWVEGHLCVNYTGWAGRIVDRCLDDKTYLGVESLWLCGQTGGVNTFSGDFDAFGGMSNLVIAKKYIGPRRNP